MAHERLSQYGGEPFAEHGGRMGLGRASELAKEHPGYSALACFGMGVAVGAAVAMLLTGAAEKAKQPKAWYEDYLPDEDFVDDLSAQVRETVRKMLPDAVARYFSKR